MVKLYNVYQETLVGTFTSRAAAEAWLSRRAQEWNYGLMRQWSMDGKDYFDCGPRVFFLYSEKSSGTSQPNGL